MNYKRNLKLTFLVAFLTLIYFSSTAQNTYFGISVGYGIPTKSSSNDNLYNEFIDPTVSIYEKVNIGYGRGLNFAAKVGFGISKSVIFEVNANYLRGNTSTVTQTYNEPSFMNSKTVRTFSSNMIQISPAIVFHPNNSETAINPYTRFGFTAGFGRIFQSRQWQAVSNIPSMIIPPDIDITDTEFYGGIALGVNAAIGANYQLSEKISLFGELSFLSLSYSPKKGTITKFTRAGVDLAPDFTTREREIEFHEKFTRSSDSYTNYHEPTKLLAITAYYSNLGLNIGMKINL